MSILQKAKDALLPKREQTPENVKAFRDIVATMADTYEKKNSDYGNSFDLTYDKYGMISAITRMSDKWNRIENIFHIGKGMIKVEESLEDTLIDLACYCIMFVMKLRKDRKL